MILRRAKHSDSALLFRLRTEAVTMMYAVVEYHSRWAQHIRGLEQELSNPELGTFLLALVIRIHSRHLRTHTLQMRH